MTHVPQFTTEGSEPRGRALFKADHPRDIDRHIDFFGTHDGGGRDMCGEALLDALTGREPDDRPRGEED